MKRTISLCAIALLELMVSVVIMLAMAAVALPLLPSPASSTATSVASFTPHSSGGTILLLLAPAALLAIALAGLWLTWHFRAHAKKSLIAISSQEATANSSSTPTTDESISPADAVFTHRSPHAHERH